MGSHGNSFISFLPSAAFLPSDISDLKLWLDVNDAATITKNGGDLVSQWDDKSGEGNDVTAAGSARPLWVDAVQNGLPIIRFDGVDDLLVSAAFSGGALTQPTTVFVVCKMASISSGSNSFVFDGIASGNRHAMIDLNLASANGYSLFAGALIQNTVTPIDMTNILLYDMIINGVSSELFKSGVSLVSGDTGSNTMTGITIAAEFGGGFNSNIDIAEIVLYNKTLTAQEKTDLTNYFNTKWGL